jgi:ribonuclease HI
MNKISSTNHTSFINIIQLNQDRRHSSAAHFQNILSSNTSPFFCHILLLQEPQLYKIPDYHSFPPHQFCASPTASILCHKSLQAAFIPQFSSRDRCLVRIQLDHISLVLISIYNHRNIPPQHLLAPLPENILRHSIIAYDTNASSPRWGSPNTCPRGRAIEAWMAQFNLQSINVLPHPPSFQQNKASSFIDVTIVSASILKYLMTWQTLPQSDFGSGHIPFQMSFSIQTPHFQQIQPTNILNHYDPQSISKNMFIHFFKDIFWQTSIFIPPNCTPEQIDNTITQIVDIFHQTIKKTATIKKTKQRINPWWTSQLASIQKQVQKKYKIFRKSPTQLHMSQYKQLRKTYVQAIKDAKQTWLSSQLQNIDNPFKLLRWVKSTSHIGHLTFSQDGQPILDANENANHLLNSLLIDDPPDTPLQSKIREQTSADLQTHFSTPPPITVKEVTTAIDQVNPKKAPGPDSIRPFMLHWVQSVIAVPLSNIFTQCLNISYFPNVMKNGNLKTIPKPNYPQMDSHKALRPITLLDALGKVFERILLNRFENDPHHKFHPSQMGFSKTASTELAHQKFLHFLESNVHGPYGVATLQLDIASAFDRAWHPAILRHLLDMGFPIYLCKMIASFLSNRHIHMDYANGSTSKVLTISVPQGAVLSPFLWKVYIDPLFIQLEELPNIFNLGWADDDLLSTKYHKHHTHTIQQNLYEALLVVKNWCDHTKAIINTNPGKSELVCFQTKTLLNFTLQTPFEHSIQSNSNLKFLGVRFDSKLTFKPHVQHIISSYYALQQTLTTFYVKSLRLSPNFIHKIYAAVIVPKMFYSVTTWVSVLWNSFCIKKIQLMLNDIARHITKATSTTPIPFLLSLAKMPTATQLITHQALLITFRLLHHINPLLRNHLQQPTQTRSHHILTIILHKSNIKINHSPLQPLLSMPSNITISHRFDSFVCVQNHQHILFTDGSKPKQIDKPTGASFVIFQGKNFQSPLYYQQIQLQPTTTNNIAEGTAILSAISSLHKNLNLPLKPHPAIQTPITFCFPFTIDPTTIHLYTDSQVCLHSLHKPQQSFYPHLFFSIWHLIQSLNCQIHFHYIPAHTSHPGNELADYYAKMATTHTPPQMHIYTPPSYSTFPTTKTSLSKLYQTNLESNWEKLVTHKPHIQNFFPSYVHLQKFLQVSHKFPLLNNLITSHLPIYAHLHRMNIKEGPACPVCLCPDDIDHLLFSCLKYTNQRRQLLSTLMLSTHLQQKEQIFGYFRSLDLSKLAAVNSFLEQTIYSRNYKYKRKFNLISVYNNS